MKLHKCIFLWLKIVFCCKSRVGNLRPSGRIRFAKAFYPARDLLLSSGPRSFFFSNDRYAAINRQNASHRLAKTYFCLFFAINSVEKRPGFLAKPFLFWSAGMVAARWNLVTTGCDPLVQKDADPCKM